MKKWKYRETKKTLTKRLRRQAIRNMKNEIIQEFQLWLSKQGGEIMLWLLTELIKPSKPKSKPRKNYSPVRKGGRNKPRIQGCEIHPLILI